MLQTQSLNWKSSFARTADSIHWRGLLAYDQPHAPHGRVFFLETPLTRFHLAVCALVTTAFWGLSAQAQSIKPGLWELRAVKHMVDGVDQSAQMAAAQQQMKAAMAKMPPEQRKQMESTMAGMTNGTHRLCISPAMAAQDKPVMPSDAKCDPPISKRSGSRTDYEFSCQQGGNTVKGKGQSEVSGDRVVTRMDMTTSGPQGKHTMQTESEMRFVSADCGNVKPADQLAVKQPAKR